MKTLFLQTIVFLFLMMASVSQVHAQLEFLFQSESISESEIGVTYENPIVDRYGLYRCREWGENCGLPAASAFCVSKGDARATDFSVVERNQKTKIINGGQICDEAKCSCISKLVCER